MRQMAEFGEKRYNHLLSLVIAGVNFEIGGDSGDLVAYVPTGIVLQRKLFFRFAV